MLIMKLMIPVFKKTAYVEFNDENQDNVRFLKVNSLPNLEEHLTPKKSLSIKLYLMV